MPEVPADWSLVRLSDLGEVNRGRSRHRPRYAEHLYGGPYPFIQTGDVKASGGRIAEYTQTYSDAGLAQSRLWPVGTMCITIAANIAETGILSFPACFPDSIIGFVADDRKCDVFYVEYAFRYMKRSIQYQASGSVQDNINLQTLETLEFPLPPLAEQRAIAHILGSLDDKIELNRRMNATLEATARALFQSWFVDFDPVHAKARGEQPAGMDAATAALFPDSFEESELGLIPKGWRVGTLGDVLELAYGKALKADKRNDGNVPVYGSNGLVGWHDEKLASGPGIVVGRKGNPGTVTWVSVDFFPIDTTFYVVPMDSSPPLEFLLFLLELQDLPSLSADSAVPGLNRNIAYMNKLIWPDESLAKLFTSIAQSVLGKIAQNEHESRTLAETRDALLPKLVSGEVRVGEMEV